jgi:hypothetical protein
VSRKRGKVKKSNSNRHGQTQTRTSLAGIISKFSSLFVGKEDEKGGIRCFFFVFLSVRLVRVVRGRFPL